MNKKLSAFFIIAIFLVSLVPMAFADSDAKDDETDDSEDHVSDDSDTDADDTAAGLLDGVLPGTPVERCIARVMYNHPNATTERVRHACQLYAAKLVVQPRPQLVNAARERADNAKDRAKAAQDRAKDALDHAKDARKRYVRAKKNFQEARKDYQESRDKFQTARGDVKKCKEDDSETCAEHRKEMRREAPKFLLRTADTVLHTLERVKAKIDESDMSDEKKAELIADLDARISAVKDAAATIESMDENTPKEDVQDAANTIREEWKKSRLLLRRVVNHMVNAKLGNIVHQAEKLAEKLGNIRDRLDAKGKDVSAIDSALADFEAKLTEAKALHKQALDTFSDDESSVQKAQDLHKQAQKTLKEARDSLREVVKAVRAATGPTDDADDSDNGTDDERDDEDKSNGGSEDDDSDDDESNETTQ